MQKNDAVPSNILAEQRKAHDLRRMIPAHEHSATNSVRAVSVAIVVGATVLSLLLLSILLLQLHGIARHYQYYTTTGGETQCVYGIWKVQEGHPLYSWPNKEFYQLTLYNFGFYYFYAWALNFLGAHREQIMLFGRYLTAALSVAGMIFQILILNFLTKEIQSRAVKCAILLVSFCAWFNSYFPGYYPVSVRPDIGAVALSTLALYFFLRYAASDKLTWLAVAATTWAATWCFKQADIACLFGAGVYLVLSRKWSAAVIFSGIFAILVGLVILRGSPQYLWNILVAPTANGFFVLTGAHSLLIGIALSLFTWTCVATLPMYVNRIARGAGESRLAVIAERMRPGRDLAPLVVLVFAVLFGGIPSVIALAKKGSSLNQMLEVYVAASSLSFVLALRLAAILPPVSARRLSIAIGASLLSMCIFPVCQLGMHKIGPIVRATDADICRKEKFASFVKTLKKPVYIEDEIFTMPWISTDNQFPTIYLDRIFYDDAVVRGLIPDGVERLVREHWFATLYISENNSFYKAAIAANYRKVPITEDQAHCLNSVGRESAPCVLLAAP